MKLFGGFHGNRTKGTAKQPIPEETKEPVRKEPVPAQQAPTKAPEAAAPAAAEETRRIEAVTDAGAKAEGGPQAPAKAPEAAAPTAAAEETRRIETISEVGAAASAKAEGGPRTPARAPEAAAPAAAAEETRRIETITEVGAAASAKAEGGPQAPAKAPEAAAPAAAEETRRIETISDAGARSPAQPEAAPAKPEEKHADTDAKPASDKRGKGLEKTRVFPVPETENEAGGAGEPGTGENPEKTIVFRTPEEEAEIEEIIAAYQKKKRRRRIIVLAILAVLVIGGVVLWKSLVKPPEIIQPTAKPTAQPTAKPTAKPTATPGPGEATPEPTPEETLPPERMRRENVYTFMMVGRDQVGGNTDTIMVGVFDVDAGEVNVVSIPRDTCANVDSNPRRTETKKISGIYARAGFDGLRDAVADMCGFPIDCYVSVGINGFIQLVNTIGGVTFYVPHNMNYDDPTQDLHIHFSAGEQYINGYDAIKVVRWRQNNDGTNYGDIDRINTQQSFLKTVFKQCLTLPNLVNNLDDYIAIFQEYVKTDLTTGNMTWFAKEFLKLQMDNIHFHTMPSNYNDMIGGFSYGTILVDEWLQMLNENLNPYDQPITLEDVDLIYRDEEGTLCATSGEIRGGMDSFLTMQEYLNMLHAWQASQQKDEDSAASGGGEADSAPPAEQPAESGDTNGGE